MLREQFNDLKAFAEMMHHFHGAMRTPAEIRQLLRRLEGEAAEDLEGEELEFKVWEQDFKAMAATLRKAVVCLANQRGGEIVVGVRDRRRTRREALEGVGPVDSGALRRAIYDGTDPHVLVDIEDLVEPEGRLLVIHVPRGMPPHTTSDGLALIRIGKTCAPLTGRALAALLAGGRQLDPSAEVLAQATREDIDPREIARLRDLLGREAQQPSLASLDDEALLQALGLVGRDGVTRAAVLLLGRGPVVQRLVPTHEITFLRFRSATRYDQRRDLRGPLLACLQELEELVSANNRVRTAQEEGFGQFEFPDLAWEAAREAVLNAVTHRDYFARQGVTVALHRERLEITSPGGFIGGVTAENILRHPPVHRNELLARVLQTIGLVNRVGLGVDRIHEVLLRLGKDVPAWSADEGHVRLSLPLETLPAFALLVARQQRLGQPLDLDALLVLRALVRTAGLTRFSAASVLQLPAERAAAVLAGLRGRGLLVVRGRGQGATYDLARELAEALRGRDRVDAEMSLDEEGVRLRILELLRERGRLTNAEIRRFSGYDRLRVYKLLKRLEGQGRLRFEGRGRGGHVVPADRRA